jgi:hypothetical protein
MEEQNDTCDGSINPRVSNGRWNLHHMADCWPSVIGRTSRSCQGPLVSQCSVSRKTRQLLWRENCSVREYTHKNARRWGGREHETWVALYLSGAFCCAVSCRFHLICRSRQRLLSRCLVRAKRSAFSHCRQQHTRCLFIYCLSRYMPIVRILLRAAL